MARLSRASPPRALPGGFSAMGEDASTPNRSQEGPLADGLYLPLYLRLAGLLHVKHVASAVLGDPAHSRPRKMRSAHHHVAGYCPVEQLSARGFRHRAILIVPSSRNGM